MHARHIYATGVFNMLLGLKLSVPGCAAEVLASIVALFVSHLLNLLELCFSDAVAGHEYMLQLASRGRMEGLGL